MDRLRERELLDREREQAVVRDALAAGRRGDGTLVLVEGPAGIGKTALVSRVLDEHADAGPAILRGRGAPRETGFAYGVVRQLLEPLVVPLDAAARERALEGPAQRAAVLFDAVDPATTVPLDAGYAMLHGLYWLVVNLARDTPLVISVDDVQWADPPSLRFVEHLARRLDGLPVTLVLARRPGESADADDLVQDLAREPSAVSLPLGPLGPDATRRLIRSAFDQDASDEFCAACHAITGGNPLLVRQTAGELARRGVTPTADAVAGVTDLMASAIAELVASRLRTVGPDGIELVATLCVLGPSVDRALAERVARLRPEAAGAAVGRLQALDIVALGPDLEFCHPLVRAAVEQHLGPDLLARTHRRAADVLASSGAASDAVAAHLLLATPAGDPWVVETLLAAAHTAAARGAGDTAREMLERALTEPPASPAATAAVRHQLGAVVSLSDMAAAVPILTDALAETADPRRRALIATDLAFPLMVCLRTRESVERLDAARTDPGLRDDPELAAALEATALSTAQWDLSMADDVAARLERVRPLARPDTEVGRLLLVHTGVFDAITRGMTGVRQVRGALDAGLLGDVGAHSPPFGLACVTLLLGGDHVGGSRHVEAGEQEVGRTGSPVGQSHLANARAVRHLYRGALADAEAEAIHGLEVAEVPMGLPTLVGSLVDSLVGRGEIERARSELERFGGQGVLPPLLGCLLLLASRMRLKVAAGDPVGALEDGDLAASWMGMLGGTTALPIHWQPAAAEAQLALGDRLEARRLADLGMDVAERLGEPRARAIAHRVLAACVEPAEALALLTTATSLAEEAGARLELARAQVDRAALLGVAGRAAEARDALRAGYDDAVRCGATPLAERAHAALVELGARPRRATPSGPSALTPAELRVARIAAAGRSNREAAGQLFVTVKTVEMHLSSTYRKLGIRSRSQLAEALDGPADVPGAP